jgi:hypothetical protein
VKALYADLLLRPVDASSLQSMSAFLAGGGSPSVLVPPITRSREYVQQRVRQDYVDVLGRSPDAAGLATWTTRIVTGAIPVDDLQRRLYTTQEFVNRSGGTSEGYVALLYASALGRAASPAEVSAWAAGVDHYGRGWVVDRIWFSTEAAMHRVGDYYRLFLKRNPDASGLAASARLLLSKGEGAVRAGLVGSPEYRLRALQRYP